MCYPEKPDEEDERKPFVRSHMVGVGRGRES